MPRKTILSTDDLRTMCDKHSQWWSDALIERVRAWAKSERSRRVRAGKAGGRPKGSTYIPDREIVPIEEA